MAREERKKEDLYIKSKRKATNFFVTSSTAMTGNKTTKTTISSSVFNKMSQSFSKGEHLTDNHSREMNGGILYMMQQMQEDIDDVYNEVSASSFEASFFPFATLDTGSFGVISSSFIPDKDNHWSLGSSGNEWKDLYVDGTANIDSLAMGTTVTAIKDEDNMASDSATSLATQQSIKKYVDDNGGGTVDTALKNGSTNAVTNNAVFDGLALKLNLAGGTMTGLISPIVQTVNGAKLTNPHDVRVVDIIEISAGGKAWTLTNARSAHSGQKLTIIALTAGTIVHGAGNAANQFQCAAGKNLTVAIRTAVTFITNSNGIWYQVV